MIHFGTSGFRAIIGDEFTKENVQKIAYALAKIMKQDKNNKPIVIGYDKRFMGRQFAIWFAEVMANQKIPSYVYTTTISSPAVMYAAMVEDFAYGVIITASHNPYQYSGIKICVHGGQDAQPELTEKLEKIANSAKNVKALNYEQAQKEKLIVDYDNNKEYLKGIQKFISKDIKNNKLKVIFNAMHGTTAEHIGELAKAYKLQQFTLLNSDTDPYFGYSLPCPNEETLTDFKSMVVKGHYSIGVASDGDGDRLGVITEKGDYLDYNIVMAIIYYYLIKYRKLKGDVVKNVATSNILDMLAEKFGYKCHTVPVGFKYTSSKMKETNAIFGGEQSGGLTMKGYIPSKDGLFAMSLLLDAMATIKKPLTKIVEEVKDFAGYISSYRSVDLKVKNKAKLIKTLNKITPQFSYKPEHIDKMEGWKYIFEDGSWILIRFSGTEDLLKVYMEFPTEIECERNMKYIHSFLNKYDN